MRSSIPGTSSKTPYTASYCGVLTKLSQDCSCLLALVCTGSEYACLYDTCLPLAEQRQCLAVTTCKALGMHPIHESHMGNFNLHQHQATPQKLVERFISRCRAFRCCSSCFIGVCSFRLAAERLSLYCLLWAGLGGFRGFLYPLLDLRAGPVARCRIPCPHLGLPIPTSILATSFETGDLALTMYRCKLDNDLC